MKIREPRPTDDTTPPPAQLRAAIVQRIIAANIDVTHAWSAEEWLTLCDLECQRSRTTGPSFSEGASDYTTAAAMFAATLTDAQRGQFEALQDARLCDLNAIEQRTAFELGRDIGVASATRRPALERFMATAQTSRRLSDRASDEDYDILRRSVDDLRRSLPVARQILLTSRPLDCVNNPLEAYIAVRTREAAKHSGLPDSDMASAEEREAVYYVGLALGLLLAEVL